MMNTVPSKNENASPYTLLLSMIYKYCGLRKLNKDTLADAMYFSRSTLYNRLRAPDTFTFTELKRLFEILRVSDDDVLLILKTLFSDFTAMELVS